MTTLKNKVVLVTGASKGIGRATALKLAAQDAEVIAIARSTIGLDKLSNEASRRNLSITPMHCDVTNFDALNGIVQRIVQTYKTVSYTHLTLPTKRIV